ncbi:MAG: hypothetical protein RIS92_1322 [Verrucomicrobiota bacterium]
MEGAFVGVVTEPRGRRDEAGLAQEEASVVFERSRDA